MADASSPVTLVILGASGDLTQRLLLPGLGTLLKAEPDLNLTLIGASNLDWPQEKWAELVTSALPGGGCPDARVRQQLGATHYVQLDVTDATQMGEFLAGLSGQVVLYFALPPAVTMKACEALAHVDLPAGLRLAIEKPFGTDLASAQHFNALLAKLVHEDQIFRVDHFLGKATVLNLLGLRFANRILEPVWNSTNIERVELISDEVLALEGRAGYYDHAGAMKDMIQSHLLLVMAMFAMEEPARLDALELRDLMVHTLRSTHLWQDDPVASSRRARYTAGTLAGRQIPSYVDEPGVDPERQTETLAEVTVEIRNSRWSGVPFRLRSGKALGDGVRGMTVVFRPVEHQPEGFTNQAARDVLTIGMSPETLALTLATNAEGSRWDLEQTSLAAKLGDSPIRPYGQILDGIIHGDPMLAVRGDVAEECWRILTPVVEAWADGRVPLDEYRAGSSGPKAWSAPQGSDS
ncbi:glucose-6-phosphate 1-dehydrogenase [Raineyella antarctica]|uniref:Glucose-6-phosphate 1-dehydrogenase n=1 Tax=Raineyella antarctica TaxID=1577474 RepID=A0A1G6IME1_9ACTN|nr:glucose-6-phosphate dehydrogenase [Raineyella antarctica]SDC07668.1 glucose-6-phosphate 1-dehydrogenase [Raineyella antarctica]